MRLIHTNTATYMISY